MQSEAPCRVPIQSILSCALRCSRPRSGSAARRPVFSRASDVIGFGSGVQVLAFGFGLGQEAVLATLRCEKASQWELAAA